MNTMIHYCHYYWWWWWFPQRLPEIRCSDIQRCNLAIWWFELVCSISKILQLWCTEYEYSKFCSASSSPSPSTITITNITTIISIITNLNLTFWQSSFIAREAMITNIFTVTTAMIMIITILPSASIQYFNSLPLTVTILSSAVVLKLPARNQRWQWTLHHLEVS